MRSYIRVVVAAGCALLAHSSCKSQDDEPRVGSETNFLKHCDSDCGEGLTCLCGVCTRACTGTTDCSSIGSESQCEQLPAAAGSGMDESCQGGAICDKVCVSRADCSALGSGYRCDAGYCRKGGLLCPAKVLASGDREQGIVVDGTTRTYTLHVPAKYAGDAPVPLVLDFHPIGSDRNWEKANSGYGELAEQEGFLVAWPQGFDNTWDVGPCCAISKPADDLGFARAIVRQLSTQACIDPRRVYAVGFSLGGMMAYYLGCSHAEVFAAIAPSSMDLFADSVIPCEPSRPVTEISFRGTADDIVPYAGGVSSPPGHPEVSNELLGAQGTFHKWASIDRCTGAPSVEDANGCSTYSSCQGSAEVTLCTTSGGSQVKGAPAIAWDMLSRHPMP